MVGYKLTIDEKKDFRLAVIVVVVVFLVGFLAGRASAKEKIFPDDFESNVFEQVASALKVHTGEINNTKYVQLDSLAGGHVTIIDPADDVYEFFKKKEGKNLK